MLTRLSLYSFKHPLLTLTATARYPCTRPVPTQAPVLVTPRLKGAAPHTPPSTPACRSLPMACLRVIGNPPAHSHTSSMSRTCAFFENTIRNTLRTRTTIHQPPHSVSHSMHATSHSLPSTMTPGPMSYPLARDLCCVTSSESPSDAPAPTTASISKHASRQHTSPSSNPGSSSPQTSWHSTNAIHSCRIPFAHAYT
jgi:hypothetical protein